MGTTIFLSGLGGNLKIKYVLGGELAPLTSKNPSGAAENQKVINATWPGEGVSGFANIHNSHAHVGATNMFNQIVAALPTATPEDPIRVVGHSGGGQCIAKMLRELMDELLAAIAAAGKTVDCIVVYLLGFPESKFYGNGYLYPAEAPPIYPGNGEKCGGVDALHAGPHDSNCPTALEHHGGHTVGSGLPPDLHGIKVHVVTNQYDGHAHVPTNPNHPEINKSYDFLFGLIPRKVWQQGLLNAYLKSASGPHGRYDVKGAKGLTSSDAFGYVDPAQPTVTYWIIRTYPWPGFDKVSVLVRWLKRNKDMKARVSIDGAYGATDSTHGQQITVPAPNYLTVATWFPLD